MNLCSRRQLPRTGSTNSQTDRDGTNGVVLQVSVALGGSGLTMPKYLADEVEAVAAGYGDRGEAVPKVMNADIVEPGRPADALPGKRSEHADSLPSAAILRRERHRGDRAHRTYLRPEGSSKAIKQSPPVHPCPEAYLPYNCRTSLLRGARLVVKLLK